MDATTSDALVKLAGIHISNNARIYSQDVHVATVYVNTSQPSGSYPDNDVGLCSQKMIRSKWLQRSWIIQIGSFRLSTVNG